MYQQLFWHASSTFCNYVCTHFTKVALAGRRGRVAFTESSKAREVFIIIMSLDYDCRVISGTECLISTLCHAEADEEVRHG